MSPRLALYSTKSVPHLPEPPNVTILSVAGLPNMAHDRKKRAKWRAKRAPFLIFGEIPCTHGLVVTQGAPDGLVRQKTQQSIHQSTHFFSTTKCFGRNTRFLAHLRNLLTTSNLQTSHNFRNSVFHFKHCERCLTEVQNMPNRNSKDGRPSLNTCQTPTRKMPFRNFFTHFLVFHLAKTAFSFSISRKILTQLFNHFP